LFAEKASIVAVSGFGIEILEEDREKLMPAAAALAVILNQSGLLTGINIAKKTTQNAGVVHIIVGSKPLN
jgi:hypothetical protein